MDHEDFCPWTALFMFYMGLLYLFYTALMGLWTKKTYMSLGIMGSADWTSACALTLKTHVSAALGAGYPAPTGFPLARLTGNKWSNTQRKTTKVAKKPISVPSNAHPLVQQVFVLLDKTGMTYQELADRAKISPRLLERWRGNVQPQIGNLEKVLNALGYNIVIYRDHNGWWIRFFIARHWFW